MRSAERSCKVFAGALAWIDEPSPTETLPCSPVERCAPALLVGSIGAAHVGSLVPVDAEPAKVLEGSLGVLGAAAVAIEVLHAHNQRSTGLSRALPSPIKRAGMSQVKMPGRRRGESAAIGDGGHAQRTV